MKEILRLALRNLKEHKSKTIIISLFLITSCKNPIVLDLKANKK